MKRECETCIKRKTLYCPSSIECMATDDMPYYQNRIMLLEENKQLKDNWNKLKKFILKKQAILFDTEYTCYSNVLDKMQELEQGSDSNE